MDVRSRDELKELGGIYIENVLSGFDQYEACTWHLSLEQYADMMSNMQKQHSLYADFYYGRITKENRPIFEQHLDKKQMEGLDKLCRKCEEYGSLEYIIFKPSMEELQLLVEISFKELLFSTFYVVDLPVTIWSNYSGEFIGFAKEKEVLGEIACNY